MNFGDWNQWPKSIFLHFGKKGWQFNIDINTFTSTMKSDPLLEGARTKTSFHRSRWGKKSIINCDVVTEDSSETDSSVLFLSMSLSFAFKRHLHYRMCPQNDLALKFIILLKWSWPKISMLQSVAVGMLILMLVFLTPTLMGLGNKAICKFLKTLCFLLSFGFLVTAVTLNHAELDASTWGFILACVLF